MEWICVLIGVLFSYVIIKAIVSPPATCTICEAEIKKNVYKWKIEGQNEYLCPNCNSKMKKKKSNAAFKKRFG